LRPAAPHRSAGVLLLAHRCRADPKQHGSQHSEDLEHMATDSNQGTWLTQEAYDRLKGELDELIANRPAMAAEINARREEGDLRENGGYHAAKEEQGKQEGRIRQ